MAVLVPRAAATVMLLRDGLDGLEVFLLERNPALEFAAGAHVFPGGAVDPGDRGEEAWAACAGRTDPDASRQLGLGSGGLAYWVAAIRECFEESGVLLARHRSGAPARDSFERQRSALDRGELSMGRFCADADLELVTDQVHYFGHWITPAGPPRRYDTRFFVTRVPEDQDPGHDDREAVASEWMRPIDALGRATDGDIGLVEPTVRSLAALARFDSADDALAAVAGAVTPDGSVHTHPELQGTRVRLPFDPGPTSPESPALHPPTATVRESRSASQPVGAREW